MSDEMTGTTFQPDAFGDAVATPRPIAGEPVTFHNSLAWHYPPVKEPTGRVQFAKNRAEVVMIDKLGEIRRAQVVAVKNPNYARGLVANGSFSHVAADTPLGQPADLEPPQILSTDEVTEE